ncbi:MAG: hypothetical protein P8K10_05465, partial [Crocinitomicaceae bacterium]|nr:hypothetical protein [Crocinitomicaceae bacterium]
VARNDFIYFFSINIGFVNPNKMISWVFDFYVILFFYQGKLKHHSAIWRKEENQLLAYSLGNFVSNQASVNSDGGMMLELTLVKKRG